MPGVEVNIEIYCSCGEGICNHTVGGTDYRGNPIFTVEPCEKCLERAKEEGRDEGYNEGIKDAS